MKHATMMIAFVFASAVFADDMTVKPDQSINDALKQAKPGDTITLEPGVYRQTINLNVKGTTDKPVTLKGPAEGIAIISGADLLKGGEACTAATAAGAPRPEKLFRYKLGFTPTRLYAGIEDGETPVTEMRVARTPNEGWWGIKKGLSLSEFIVGDDAKIPENLDDTWTVAILEQAGGGLPHIKLKAWGRETGKITLAQNYSRYRKVINEKRDRFFLENHLSALDQPGEYVIVPGAGKGCALYVWPPQMDKDGKPLVLASKRVTVSMRGAEYVTVDGLEIAYSAGQGFSLGNTDHTKGLDVRNCFIHDAESYGMGFRSPQDVKIVGNVIWGNSLGVNVGGDAGSGVLVKHNDIGWNRVDGLVGPGSKNLTLQSNYIHDHYLWGHPDNIQFWGKTDGLKVLENVFLHSGQGIMSGGMGEATFRNNIFAGTGAIAFIIGAKKATAEHNTIAASEGSLTNLSPNMVTYESLGNIYSSLSPSPQFGWREGWTFDYDLIWACKGYSKALAVKGRWKDSASSLPEMQKKFNIEANGRVDEPKFISAPACVNGIPYNRPQDCTRSKLILRNASLFKVGDIVEVRFDTIPRKVVKIEGDAITIEPPLKKEPTTSYQVANWKQTNAKKLFWDLRPGKDSPAKGAGPNGKDIGSSLSIPAYIKGDFNGDGKRDRTWTKNMARWLKGNGFEARIPE